MAKLKNIIAEAFREAIISEARVLPSDSDIASCPSVYKAIRKEHLQSYIEHGFQHQLAGNGGTMRGEGVYASLELSGGIQRSAQGYGSVILRGKVLGGFKNYIMFDADRYPSIKRQVIKYYGRLLTPDEQIDTIIKDPIEAAKVKREGVRLNNYPETVRICRKWGVRGMMYDDYVATVLPFDFSSVILWDVADGVSRYDDENSVKSKFVHVFDTEARERYERGCDWDFQLRGYFDDFDKTSAVKVATNNELYCIVRNNGMGYNIAKVDTDNIVSPKPEVISDVWFNYAPTSPGRKNGIFSFKYGGQEWYATVFQPTYQTVAVWYPEADLKLINRPDLNDENGWLPFNKQNMDEILADYREKMGGKMYRPVVEGIETIFRKNLEEEITDKDENEFINKRRCYVYRATAPSNFKSIFSNGQLRQFAGSNDGSWYGEGVYAVLDPNAVQYYKYDKETHAGGVKMIVYGGFNRFLIFNEEWAKKVYKGNYRLKDQIYFLFPKDVADDVWAEMSDWMNKRIQNCQDTLTTGTYNRTTGMLHVIFDRQYGNSQKYQNLFSKYNVRGAIYVGGNDGLSMVCWNFDQVIPYQYTTDCGKTWHSDLFDFQAAKERSIRNNDPVQKFRHAFAYVSDEIVHCNIDGTGINVTTVKTRSGKYNIIDINKNKDNIISPIDFDAEPSIGTNGIFSFRCQGVSLYGVVRLPSQGVPAIWYPEDFSKVNKVFAINVKNEYDWIGFEQIGDVIQDVKSRM